MDLACVLLATSVALDGPGQRDADGVLWATSVALDGAGQRAADHSGDARCMEMGRALLVPAVTRGGTYRSAVDSS